MDTTSIRDLNMVLPTSDVRYAQRHIERQTGLLLSPMQVNDLWGRTALPTILSEVGYVRSGVCVAMVDLLCNDLLGQDWPVGGGDGSEPKDTFFHNFTAAAISAGYQVASKQAA